MIRALADLSVSLNLFDTVKQGEGHKSVVTDQIGKTWRRSIRSNGGCWLATADWEGESWEMEELFLSGLARVIKETLGGLVTWQGFVGRMEYTKKGNTYVRDWLDIANAVKVKYQKTSDNKLTNGSAETGAWTSVGTPTTNAQSTAWRCHGDNSDHIVTDSANEGATIGTALAVIANKSYDVSIKAKIVSGTWQVQIIRTDTNAVIASASEDTAGLHEMQCSLADTNTYAGNTAVRLICTTSTGEIYGDEAVYHDTPKDAETGWYTDTDSIAAYGRCEIILDETNPVEVKATYSSTTTGKGKKKKTVWTVSYATDDAATARAQTYLKLHAWPRTQAPDSLAAEEDTADKLSITFYGDAYLLRNKYTLLTGTDAASDHITAAVGESEFITAGIIDANTMNYQIDDSNPPRGLDLVQAIVKAGDTSGNRWVGGVFAGRLYDYNQAGTALSYHYRDGELLMADVGGAQEPWLAQPGYAEIDDLPISPMEATTGTLADDQRVVYLDEVEFDAAAWLEGKSGLNVRRTDYD